MNKSYNTNPNTVNLSPPQQSSLPVQQPQDDIVFDPKQILHEISTQQNISIPQLQSQIKDLKLSLKELVGDLRKLKKDVSLRPTINHMMENTVLVTSMIQGDPNIMKLIKSKQTTPKDETTRKTSQQQQQSNLIQKSSNHQLKHLSTKLGNKLSTISQGLSILYSMFKQLQKSSQTQLSQIRAFLQQKTHSIQDQLNVSKMQDISQRTSLIQKLQAQYESTQQKLRAIQTKQSWQAKQLKTKLHEKLDKEIFQKTISQSLQQSKKMFKTFCQTSTQLINPDKITSIQHVIKANQQKFIKQITQFHLKIDSIDSKITKQLISAEFYRKERTSIQKRLSSINVNFAEIHGNVTTLLKSSSQHQQRLVLVQSDLLQKTKSMRQMKATLRSLSITEEFQQMLSQIDPEKILNFQKQIASLQDSNKHVYKLFTYVNQEIDKINSKFDISGILIPNKSRQKEYSLNDLRQIIDEYFVENRFANKISKLQSDVNQSKATVEAIKTLQKKVSRLQKQTDCNKILQQFNLLQERVCKQIKTLSSKIQTRISQTEIQRSFIQGLTSRPKNVENQNNTFQQQQQLQRSKSFRKTSFLWENANTNTLRRELSSSRIGKNTVSSARKSLLLSNNLFP